jgi:hypothetical protein
MISHRSFWCPDWVKVAFLVAGSWAMENSPLKWSANHARHHARVDQEEDPYNATKGFWHSHCVWFFMKSPYRTERYAPWLRKDRVVMWQHRWYVPLLLSGLALPFLVGYAYNGGRGGVGCFLLAGGRADLFSPEFHFLHQFRLSSVGDVSPTVGPIPVGTVGGCLSSPWERDTIIIITPFRGTIGTGLCGTASTRQSGSFIRYPSLDSPKGWLGAIRTVAPGIGLRNPSSRIEPHGRGTRRSRKFSMAAEVFMNHLE